MDEPGIPGRMLQRKADHEEDEFEFGNRNGQFPIADSHFEESRLEWNSVILRQIVAHDKLVMGVDMDDLIRRPIVSIVVFDARQKARRIQRLLESEPMHYGRKSVNIGSTHEKIQIVLSCARAIKEGVALPMAVSNCFGLQRVA